MSWLRRLAAKFAGIDNHIEPEEPISNVRTNKERDAFIAAQEVSTESWAMFEIAGFEDDGRIKVQFSWNKAFIKKLNDLGFTAETEEDSVQLFFYTSQMRPTEIGAGDDPVQSVAHPQLSDQQNVLRR